MPEAVWVMGLFPHSRNYYASQVRHSSIVNEKMEFQLLLAKHPPLEVGTICSELFNMLISQEDILYPT